MHRNSMDGSQLGRGEHSFPSSSHRVTHLMQQTPQPSLQRNDDTQHQQQDNCGIQHHERVETPIVAPSVPAASSSEPMVMMPLSQVHALLAAAQLKASLPPPPPPATPPLLDPQLENPCPECFTQFVPLGNMAKATLFPNPGKNVALARMVLLKIPHYWGPSHIIHVLSFLQIPCYFARKHSKLGPKGEVCSKGSGKVLIDHGMEERLLEWNGRIWCLPDGFWIVREGATEAAKRFLEKHKHAWGTHLPYELLKVEREDKDGCDRHHQNGTSTSISTPPAGHGVFTSTQQQHYKKHQQHYREAKVHLVQQQVGSTPPYDPFIGGVPPHQILYPPGPMILLAPPEQPFCHVAVPPAVVSPLASCVVQHHSPARTNMTLGIDPAPPRATGPQLVSQCLLTTMASSSANEPISTIDGLPSDLPEHVVRNISELIVDE